MAPDFESFVAFAHPKVFGHMWKGVVWFDFPLAIALTFLFHLVVKNAFVAHLPGFLKKRIPPTALSSTYLYSTEGIKKVLIGCFIGAFSHLLWDGFTHLNLRYPDATWSSVLFLHHRLYIELQYVSSIIGMAYLGYEIWRLPVVDATSGNKWYPFFLFFVMFSLLAATIAYTTYDEDVYTYQTAYMYVNVFLSAVFYGIVGASAMYVVAKGRGVSKEY